MIEDKVGHITDNLSKYLHSINFTHAVVGLSGGVDSALVAKIAATVLGAENVMAIHMPDTTITDIKNSEDAKEWASTLGMGFEQIEIDDFVAKYENLPWTGSDIATMNIKARVRATILYHYANTHDTIVLGTGNKTEALLGYFTKYGDAACDVQVIASLFKSEVWEAAKKSGIPESIINKVPTAELAAGQTDEGEIGVKYSEMDRILKDMILGNGPITDTEIDLHTRVINNRHKNEMPMVITSEPWEAPKQNCCTDC